MDNYIVSGDQAIFLPNFGSAVITPIPGVIVGSAVKTTVTGKPVCLEGDEKKVVVPGVAYINASYSIPGVGVLTIQALGGDQTSKKTTIEGKAPILKGTQFDAKFTVSTRRKCRLRAAPCRTAFRCSWARACSYRQI